MIANPVAGSNAGFFASRPQRERQRTAALRDRSESNGLGGFPPVTGDPPRSLGGYEDESGRGLPLSTSKTIENVD